ncbi:DUF2946 domain-containing protein [Pseudomonas boanensis]|uniref:DUF2946 domain-containing protein n=1 Tax=Metapseudomonas boanensis TaxID=2822138 RepID=UPI0035D3E346
MTYGRRHQRGAWLGLLAMLLVFAGPLLSQSLTPPRQAVPAWMGELACATDHQLSTEQPAQPGHETTWAKCGYCTLLFNSPALSPAPLLAGFLTNPASPRIFAAVHRGHAASAVFPNALTRAPPAVLA